MKIVYKDDEGNTCIITPIFKDKNPDTGKIWTIEEIAKKTVDTGKKFKYVEDTDIPTDRSFRDAWDVDETELTDGVGE